MNKLQELSLEIQDLNFQIKQRQNQLNNTIMTKEKKIQVEEEIRKLRQKLAQAWAKYNIEKQNESDDQTYQSLCDSTKIPIYKSVSNQCPCCMGHREIQKEKGIVVCPYCDFVEQLIVDHYVIDHEKVKQLQQKAEEERKEALIKKELHDKRVVFWIVSSFVSLIALPILLGFHRLFLTYIYFFIWSLTALVLYPTWKPLMWASIFPVPLTKLITTSDTIKQKYNLAVRILFIVGGWLAYILILGGMLLMDASYSRRNHQNSYELEPATSYTVPATTVSPRPATENTTEATTEKAAETEADTSSLDNAENIFDTFSSIPDKNGFSEDANQHIDKSYYSISIPDYYVYSEKDSDESKDLSFYTIGNNAGLAIQTLNNDNITQDDFEAQKESLTKKMIGDSYSNSIISNDSCMISGLSAQVARCTFEKNDNSYSVECCVAYYEKTVIAFLFLQDNDTITNYYPDYIRILDNIKVNESPAETEKTTLAISNYYITTDSSNDKVVVVEYSFTNTFSSNRTFMWSFSDKAFQNGVECDDADSVDGVSINEDFRTVQPGGNLKIKHAYKITDASDVTIEVKDLLGLTTYLSQKISLG